MAAKAGEVNVRVEMMTRSAVIRRRTCPKGESAELAGFGLELQGQTAALPTLAVLEVDAGKDTSE